jgi:hypothetical protein
VQQRGHEICQIRAGSCQGREEPQTSPGRADIVVSKERLGDFAGTEFARDPRTGLPVISRPQSLGLILDCYRNGVLVADTLKGWRAPTVIDEPTANLIVSRMTPLELPGGSKLMAFQWQTSVDDAPPAACAARRAQSGG